MYTKTRYKPKPYRDGGAVLADAEINIEVPADRLKPEAAEPAGDDASVAFQRQIDALKESERIQRERAAQATPALTLREQAFLKANPDFLDDHDIAHKALMQAHQAGHIQDSDEFHAAVKSNWQALRPTAEAEAAQRDLEKAFELGDVKAQRLATDRISKANLEQVNSSFVSAPVSRETQANGGYNSYGDRPGRVTLTVAMKEAARIAGISEREYAENVLRLRQEKADGHHGGQP
jgi:hypothetical protein